jgi:hypothetical protein
VKLIVEDLPCNATDQMRVLRKSVQYMPYLTAGCKGKSVQYTRCLTAGCKGKCSFVFWVSGLMCATLVQEMSTTVYGVSIAFCEKWLTETHTQESCFAQVE